MSVMYPGSATAGPRYIQINCTGAIFMVKTSVLIIGPLFNTYAYDNWGHNEKPLVWVKEGELQRQRKALSTLQSWKPCSRLSSTMILYMQRCVFDIFTIHNCSSMWLWLFFKNNKSTKWTLHINSYTGASEQDWYAFSNPLCTAVNSKLVPAGMYKC